VATAAVGSYSTEEARGGPGNCKKFQRLIARGVVDGGGARPKSARESGLPVAGGGGPGAGSGGEARALERGGRSRVGVEGVDERARSRFERLGRRRGREGKKREGGPATEMPRGAGRRCGASRRPAGGAPIVSRPAVTRMRRARAAHRCSDSGTLALTRRAPVAERAGRRGWRVGRPEKKAWGRAQMNSKALHLFELI
jgi:hypothetical protein